MQVLLAGHWIPLAESKLVPKLEAVSKISSQPKTECKTVAGEEVVGGHGKATARRLKHHKDTVLTAGEKGMG